VQKNRSAECNSTPAAPGRGAVNLTPQSRAAKRHAANSRMIEIGAKFTHRTRRLTAPGWVLPGGCFAAVLLLANPLSAQNLSHTPAISAEHARESTNEHTVESILTRMAQARAENRARFRPFVVTRNYRMFSGEQAAAQPDSGPGKPTKPRSEVTVSVSFAPPDRKTFTIGESSGGIGERTVRRILQSESESAKDYTKSDYSAANYNFRLLSGDAQMHGVRCLLLEMTPKREERTLLRGKIWVDAETYLVRRFEGVPAKSSSWWIKDEQIALIYGEVDGMWLQTGTEGTAKVRILGPHRLVSRDLKYEFENAAPVILSGADAAPPHAISENRSLPQAQISALPK
jgi:hypothetical protein